MVAPRRAPLPPAPPSPCRAPLKCGSPAPGVKSAASRLPRSAASRLPRPLCGLHFSRGAGGAGGGLPARRSLRPCRPARRGRRHRPPPGSLRCGPTQPLRLRLQGEKTCRNACRNAEMHNPSRRFRRFGGGSAFLGGGQAPASSAVQKENICSHQPGVKGVIPIETELKKIHITTQAEYWNLCVEYLSAEQYAGRFGCHLATAYRHFASVPDSCKALVINDVTGSQYTVIPKATAKTVYETQQPPGNPQLTTQHQREAAQARWHGRQGRST